MIVAPANPTGVSELEWLFRCSELGKNGQVFILPHQVSHWMCDIEQACSICWGSPWLTAEVCQSTALPAAEATSLLKENPGSASAVLHGNGGVNKSDLYSPWFASSLANSCLQFFFLITLLELAWSSQHMPLTRFFLTASFTTCTSQFRRRKLE